METVRLSVVIPCRNEAARIGAQLDRLAEQSWFEPWEIVVADNGSTDATIAVVRRYQQKLPYLRIVDASDQRGVNHARNAGAAAARGEYVVFCDADDEVQPGWLAAMGDALLRHDLVAGRIDSYTLNEPWSAALRGAAQAEGPAQFGNLSYVLGANLGVRRALHASVGGFDEEFVGGADDIDYSWRLRQAGVEPHFEPRAVVAYRVRDDFRSLFQQARFYAVGAVTLYKKHRHDGLPEQRHPWLAGLLSWVGLLKRLPIPPSRRRVARFAWSLGWKLGMLEGSVRNRVVLLSIRGII
jgi:glycosyltransferase involved in cell wall biosynthesis